MKIKHILAPFVLSVSACSGGSGGSGGSGVIVDRDESPPEAPSVTVLETFSDGSGVIRAEVADAGETTVVHAMVPQAQHLAAELNASVSGADQLLSVDHVEQTGVNEHGTIYAGNLSVNGAQVRGIIYEDYDYPVGIGYVENEDANILLTTGEKATDIPTGTYTYTGTHVVGYRDASALEDGTFEMQVDFTNGQADIDAETFGTFVTGRNMRVDTRQGTFSSDDITIDQNGGQEVSGSIHGSFHGAGAKGVTGLYHDNAANPAVAGAIAGNR